MYRKVVHQMIQVLIRKLTSLSHYEEALVKINTTATDRLTVLKAKPQAMLSICNDPFTVAQQLTHIELVRDRQTATQQLTHIELVRDRQTATQQLTHIELERLSYIGPEEFIQAFEKKGPLDNDKSCFSDHKKASNLEAYVEWFNRLSFMVATEICMPVKKKQRVRVIEFFIDVARECFNIGNFNSLMAIISGMNMSPVSRLKKTWSKVKTAKFDILEHQMDPSGNFYNYRTAFRGATQRSRTANSTREKKFWEMAKQVSEFMVWKKVESLCLASYDSEGPENNMEKDRWKSLRLPVSAQCGSSLADVPRVRL
ncbi:unnamed protein product [Coregonus sp. 'balchen']|nr:unnamed protein product [Coregonus sp. 'balchen']